MLSAEPGGPASAPGTQHSALFVSTLLHPFVVIPATLLFQTGNWRQSALVAALTVVPLLIVTAIRVRRGTWSDFDVSRREQRSGLYLWALPLTIAAALVLPAQLARGTWIAAGMLATGLLLSRFLKTSLHMMFGAFCAVLLAAAWVTISPLLLALLALLGWSRYVLERHGMAEIVVGTLIGVAGGMFTILDFRF